mmetsp:Transcript_17194/g.35950  ORF Transcript_17194/g.35950 Transcript_17194/m.35950 type:complete len:119 (-) Transcript_17194:15-371(-)
MQCNAMQCNAFVFANNPKDEIQKTKKQLPQSFRPIIYSSMQEGRNAMRCDAMRYIAMLCSDGNETSGIAFRSCWSPLDTTKRNADGLVLSVPFFNPVQFNPTFYPWISHSFPFRFVSI